MELPVAVLETEVAVAALGEKVEGGDLYARNLCSPWLLI